MSLKLKLPFFFSLLFLLYTCTADVDIQNISDEVSLHPTLIVPLGKAVFTAADILENGISQEIQAGDDGEVNHVTLDSMEFSLPRIDFLKNAKELSKDISLGTYNEVIIPPYTSIPPLESTAYLDLGINSNPATERIDSMRVNAVTLSFIINVSAELRDMDLSEFLITITFPSGKMRKTDGSELSISVGPDALGRPKEVILTDFIMDTSDGATGVPVLMTVRGRTGVLFARLTLDSYIRCRLSMSQLDYSVVYGFFDSQVYNSGTHNKSIDLNSIYSNGLLKFSNPKIDMAVISNIGAYLNFNIDYIKAFKTGEEENAVLAWFDKHTTNSMNIRIDKKPAFPGAWETFNIQTLDRDRGETHALFENQLKPDMIQYKFSASIDKQLTQKDPTPGFITSDATVKVRIKTTIPFQLNAGSYYEFQDTIPNLLDRIAASYQEYPTSRVDSVSLVLHVKNGFPSKVQMSLRLLDANGAEIRNNLSTSCIIEAGRINASGQVRSATDQVISIGFLNSDMDDLRRTNSIIYNFRLEGKDINSKIHFTTNDIFDMKVGLLVHGNVNRGF